jgi:DNA repair protein RadD
MRPYFSKQCGWWHVSRNGGDQWYREQLAMTSSNGSTNIVLRDYQNAAIQLTFDFFARHHEGNPLIAIPTGTGKSLVIADFLRKAHQTYPTTRSMVLTHVKELIVQNFQALMSVWPQAPAGIYSAGVGRRDTGNPITFAGIQSVYKKADIFQHIDLLFVDEAHLVDSKRDTMYQQFVNGLKEINPHLRVIGTTATAYRLGRGMLLEDDGGLFTHIGFDLTDRKGFNWLLQEGWLSPIIPKRPNMLIDVDGVPMSKGDFQQGALQIRVDKQSVTEAAIRETVQLAYDRHHWLIFATGIEHAENVANHIEDAYDIPASYVHSKIPPIERDARIASFKRGDLRALVNNNILTTGFDFPDIDCIVMLRPTASPGLWVQMLGRGTRPVYAPNMAIATAEQRRAAIAAGSKPNCLCLDFAGNTQRLGPINDPVLPRKKGRGPKGIAPVRLCEVCGCYSHAASRFCENPLCGVEFPKNLKLKAMASTFELVAADDIAIQDFNVTHVIYRVHKKQGKPDSMRVTYICGLRQFNEYICLDHSGYAGHIAKSWWLVRSPWGVPPSVPEGMKAVDYLPIPKKISVLEKAHGRYPEICGYDF